MLTAKKISILTIYGFLVIGLSCCGGLPRSTMNSIDSFGVNVVKVGDLKLERQEATVYLRGKVIRQVPLVDWRVYQLQDPSGSVWVLTKRTDLRLQEQVLIKGKVHYQSIPIGSNEFGEFYIEEQQLEPMPVR